jgi:hypothetical protein
VRCPGGLSVPGIVIEVRVCGSDSVGINKAVLWQVQCNWARNRSNGEDIMAVRCPVRCLGIVRRDRSCMLEQWATIHKTGLFLRAIPSLWPQRRKHRRRSLKLQISNQNHQLQIPNCGRLVLFTQDMFWQNKPG